MSFEGSEVCSPVDVEGEVQENIPGRRNSSGKDKRKNMSSGSEKMAKRLTSRS